MRDRVRFADGHLAGTVSLERSDQFATYVGWLVPWQDDIVLLADDPEDLEAASATWRRSASRASPPTPSPADQALPATYRRARWEDLRALARPAGAARRPPGRRVRRGPPRGRVNIPLHELDQRLLDLPAGEVWVYCRSGFRAGAAASILQRGGRAVVHLDDEWTRVAGGPPARQRRPGRLTHASVNSLHAATLSPHHGGSARRFPSRARDREET